MTSNKIYLLFSNNLSQLGLCDLMLVFILMGEKSFHGGIARSTHTKNKYRNSTHRVEKEYFQIKKSALVSIKHLDIFHNQTI